MQKKVVITGGPGTGKSTVIEALIQKGFTCMPEVSRQITLEAQKEGISQLFLTDPQLFSQKVLEGRKEQFCQAEDFKKDTVFFDRGLPDVHGYMNYLGVDYPDFYVNTCKSHTYTHVFMMPPWQDIYASDNERYENYKQSEQIFHHLKETYQSLGYNPIEVPKTTVNERVQFILNALN